MSNTYIVSNTDIYNEITNRDGINRCSVLKQLHENFGIPAFKVFCMDLMAKAFDSVLNHNINNLTRNKVCPVEATFYLPLRNTLLAPAITNTHITHESIHDLGFIGDDILDAVEVFTQSPEILREVELIRRLNGRDIHWDCWCVENRGYSFAVSNVGDFRILDWTNKFMVGDKYIGT